jgi:hypothetical protein
MSDELRRRLCAASSALISTFLELRKRNISRLNPFILNDLNGAKRLNPSTRSGQANGTSGTGFGIIRDALEKKYDAQFKVVFDAIRQLMTPPEPNKRKIGFLVKERAPCYGRA